MGKKKVEVQETEVNPFEVEEGLVHPDEVDISDVEIVEVPVDDVSDNQDSDVTEELDTEELEKQAEELNCTNDDCMHFDKSLIYGCGCGGENDDPPFDIRSCVNRIPVDNPQGAENNMTAHVCNIELGPEFTRFLPVPVADDILADYAREMARQHTLWVKTKIDAKAFAKSCKEITDRCEDEEIRLAEIVGSGSEEDEVRVRWSFDYSQNIKRLIRQDTMEVVEEAAMTVEDRQGDLFGRTQESIENVQNCLGQGAESTTDGSNGVEQDAIEPPDGENALESDSVSLEENEDDMELAGMESGHPDDNIEGDINEGVQTVEDLEKSWPL